MKTAKLKYPTMVAGQLYPKGTIVQVLNAENPMVQNIFPGINNNPNSTLIAVKFPERMHATIGLAKMFMLG